MRIFDKTDTIYRQKGGFVQEYRKDGKILPSMVSYHSFIWMPWGEIVYSDGVRVINREHQYGPIVFGKYVHTFPSSGTGVVESGFKIVIPFPTIFSKRLVFLPKVIFQTQTRVRGNGTVAHKSTVIFGKQRKYIYFEEPDIEEA